MTSYTEDDLRQALSMSADDVAPPVDVWSGLHRRIVRRRRMRAGAAVIGAAVVIAGAAVAVPRLGDTGSNTDEVSPAGDGTTSMLIPDRPLSDSDLGLAADLLRHRLAAVGVKDATVTAGDGGLVVTASPSSNAAIRSVAQPGALQFRQVLERVAGGGSGALTHPATAAATDLAAAKQLLADHPCAEAPAEPARPAPPASYLVTCTPDGASAYLLGPAALVNSDIAGANASVDPTTNQWLVTVDLNASGANKFFDLTARAGQADPSGVATDCGPPKGCNGIAELVDGIILSVPSVQDPNGIRGGATQITGNLTEEQARAIAAIATTAPLPATFTVTANGG